MASKGRHSQTPYKALKENPSHYIDPEHLPAHINLANPRSMKCEEIVSFFEHIIQRQQILDPPNVFRFKTVKITRKGTQTLEDMDADKSTNDEGDQDVNIGADMLPPPVTTSLKLNSFRTVEFKSLYNLSTLSLLNSSV